MQGLPGISKPVGDNRNSLVGGSALQGTWVLYLRGSIYVVDITHSAQVGSVRNSGILNPWDHVAASRWVGCTCPCHMPQTLALAPAPQKRECEHRLGTKRCVPRATPAWARNPVYAPPSFQGPRTSTSRTWMSIRESYRTKFLGQATFPRSLPDSDAARSTRCPKSSQPPHILPWGTGSSLCGLRPCRLF